MELKNFYTQDTQGNILPGAQVYVYERGTLNLVSTVVGADGNPKTNPFPSDSDGLATFAVPNGLYDVRVVSGERDTKLPMQFFDATEGMAAVVALVGQAQTAVDKAEAAAEDATNAVNVLREELAAPSGASELGYEDTTVEEELSKAKKFQTYAALRAYAGSAPRIEIIRAGNTGFYINIGTPSGYTDTGGLHIITAAGIVYEREYSGDVKAEWFRDGVLTDNQACSLAAKSVVAYALDSDGDFPLVPYCPWVVVELSEGTWTFTEEVDTGNREVVWKVPVNGRVLGAEFINGRLLREGSKITDFHHGILDSAVGFAVMSNRKMDEVAPVGGLGAPNQLSRINGRDTVGGYFGNKLPAPIYTSSTVSSYGANTVTLTTPLTAAQQRKMRRGMIIHTKHSTRYAGYVDSWTENSITVRSGWFLMNGSSTGTAVTPPGTDGVDVNVFRKAWALNANVFIGPDSYGSEAVGAEFGVSNSKGESEGMGGSVSTYGTLSVSLTASADDFYNTYSYITGGRWVYGFAAIGGVRNAFVYRGDRGRADELQTLLLGWTSGGVQFFKTDAVGNIEAGRKGGGVAAPWTLKVHSSGNNNDYDAQITSTGGTAAAGAAIFEFTAGQLNLNAPAIDFKGVARPDTDLGRSIGQASTTVRRFLDAFVQRFRPGAGVVIWTSGAGTPEGSVTAVGGSLYTRTDGGANTTLYVKESGSGATGWVAK